MKYTVAVLMGVMGAQAQFEVPQTWETYTMSKAEKTEFLHYSARFGKSFENEVDFAKRGF